MITKKRKSNGFLCSINDDNLNCRLFDSLANNNLFVVAANGKVGDLDLLSRLYMIRECVDSKKYGVEVIEKYADDGKMFTASVSFVKKSW